MSKPARLFRINVGFIAHEEVGYHHEFTFEMPGVRLENDLDLEEFSGSADVGRTVQGLLLNGTFRGRTTLECARCLKRFAALLAWQFTELFAFNQKSVSDSGLLLREDAHIDLEPLVREYALMEIPMRPLCRPDCRGLCPVCGEDLNMRDCGHRPETAGSPFASLRDFLGK